MAAYALKKPVYIVAGARTAFGKFCGSLAKYKNHDLAEVAARGALAQVPSISAEHLDTSIWGTVMFSDSGSPGCARSVALNIGMREETPNLIVNRLCGSGFQSICSVSDEIEKGMANIGLAGGAENMSNVPFMIYGARQGFGLTQTIKGVDALWEGLGDVRLGIKMGMTAENLAEKYGVTREDADNFAYRSQQNWARANAEGIFKTEIAPMKIKVKRKEVDFEVDEGPRPQTTLESLQKLPPVFKKDGVVTAGNSSTINDGAAAAILAGEEAVKQHNLKPLARIVGYSYVGVDPAIMGIGPVPAIQKLWEKTGISRDEVAMYDINEAFAAQAFGCQKVLEIDTDKFNKNGGACALGHPVGVSGTRITTHLAHELQRTGEKYAVGSACIGAGQGIAVMIERC